MKTSVNLYQSTGRNVITHIFVHSLLQTSSDVRSMCLEALGYKQWKKKFALIRNLPHDPLEGIYRGYSWSFQRGLHFWRHCFFWDVHRKRATQAASGCWRQASGPQILTGSRNLQIRRTEWQLEQVTWHKVHIIHSERCPYDFL